MKKLALILSLSFLASVASAGDHKNLEDGLPIEVTDAYPIPAFGTEAQLLTRYERTSDDRNLFTVEPRIEVGFMRNAQATLKVPTLIDTSPDAELGRISGEVLYNFNQESLALPALSLVAMVDAPTGPQQNGFDPAAKLIMTKAIPGTSFRHRLHFSGMVQYNTEQADEERRARYKLIGGYDFRITTSMVGLVGYVHEQGMMEKRESNLIEAAIRYQLTPLWVLSLGGGVGFLEESPTARGALALQYRTFTF